MNNQGGGLDYSRPSLRVLRTLICRLLRRLCSICPSQCENYGNGRIHSNRLAVQHHGFVSPLPHRIHGGLHKQRRTRNILQILNRSVLPDNAMKHDRAADMGRLRDRRIDRRHLVYKICLRHIPAEAN